MSQSQRKQYTAPTGILFDALQYVKRLESVGVPRAQAEVQAETLLQVVREQVLTKYDLKELEGKITLGLESIQRDIKVSEEKTAVELELIHRDIKASEQKTVTELALIRRDVKASEEKTATELELIRRDIKELEVNSKTQLELLRRDLKLWFGGVLVTLVVSSGMLTLVPRLFVH